MGSVRVSSAFHEHLNRHRESLMSLQNSQNSGQCNINHARLVSFQDVRNHFDQQSTSSTSNISTTRQNLCISKKKDDNDNNKKAVSETDWEDIFHRCRRSACYQIAITRESVLISFDSMQALWVTRGLRRDPSSLPQLPLSILENVRPSLYRQQQSTDGQSCWIVGDGIFLCARPTSGVS